MKNFCVIIISLLLLSGCNSAKQPDDSITVRFVRVIDGDTFIVDIENGYPPIITHNIPVRIRGIDTPELNDKSLQTKAKAFKARDYLKQRLNKAKTIQLKKIGRGKYFRIIADVHADNSNLADELLSKNYAKSYPVKKEK